jgi:hypothetical protein
VAGASNREILLQEVPDHFFDAEEWARLVTGKGSREKALSQLSVREPAIITVARRQAIEAGSERAWEARQEEDLFLLANFLVSQFNARLMSGELIATGYLKDLLWIAPGSPPKSGRIAS